MNTLNIELKKVSNGYLLAWVKSGKVAGLDLRMSICADRAILEVYPTLPVLKERMAQLVLELDKDLGP